MNTAAEVIAGKALSSCERGDVLDFLAALPPDACDLVFCSPPYSNCRLYLENGQDLRIARDAEEWAAWMKDVFVACLRVCTGLVAAVCDDQTKGYRYGCAPYLLMADLHRAGVCLRRPCIYRRVGIPGSGGPDYLRSDYEPIVCATRGGKLPWADPTACGHPPRWAPGGAMRHRLTDGTRRNAWGMNGSTSRRNAAGEQEVQAAGASGRRKPRAKAAAPGEGLFGPVEPPAPCVSPHGCARAGKAIGARMAHGKKRGEETSAGAKQGTPRRPNGDRQLQPYEPPVLANPGNVVQQTYTAEEVADLLGEPSDVADCVAGGGAMGSRLVHQNEAGFPEELATFFILTFCPPGGVVLDPFAGSGTTLSVAVRHGRRAIGCDLRESQVALSRRRLAGETPSLFGAAGAAP
jgi:DNA modification methylase